MACFCAAGIAHFCKLPRLPPRRQCPLSFFLQMAPIGPPTPSDFFANSLDWPATAPPAIKNSPTRLCRFLPGQQIAPVFCALYFSGTNQPPCKIAPIFTFFIYLQKTALFACAAILRAFLAFLFSRVPFQKTAPLLRAPKIRPYFNHTKREGIFHFKPPKQHLKLKFIFLKSIQNLWKGFLENLTMCHILSHFAGKQCAFFN